MVSLFFFLNIASVPECKASPNTQYMNPPFSFSEECRVVCRVGPAGGFGQPWVSAAGMQQEARAG